MAYGVALRVWGPYACFTRPEMKVERVSYDVITPSAARGILEAIYWRPAIRWKIERIHVLAPIRFINLRRNELASKIPIGNIKSAMKNPSAILEVIVEEDRQQRAAMVLQNVEYVIEGSFEITEIAGKPDKNGKIDPEDKKPAKHAEIFMRRAQEGQCFSQPYFGTREFPAKFEWIERKDIPKAPFEGEDDLGFMLHDIDFKNDMTAKFFRAVMRQGVIEVPPFESEEVKS